MEKKKKAAAAKGVWGARGSDGLRCSVMLSTAAGKAEQRDSEGQTLDGDQAAADQFQGSLRTDIMGKSGRRRSLKSLSIQPRKHWRIYELISPQQWGGERGTRLLLSSTLSISCLRGVGSVMLCPRMRCPHSCVPLEPSEGAGHGGDLTCGVGAELQLAAPLRAAGRAAGPALTGRLQGAKIWTVGLTAPSPTKPHRPPQKHPRGIIPTPQSLCRGGNIHTIHKAAPRADSIWGPHHTSGQMLC